MVFSKRLARCSWELSGFEGLVQECAAQDFYEVFIPPSGHSICNRTTSLLNQKENFKLCLHSKVLAWP